MFTLLFSLLFTSLSHAKPAGAELALILDTSCSMVSDIQMETGGTLPANDPERASILGTLVIEGLMRGGSDGYTLYGLPKNKGGQATVLKDYNAIRNVNFVNQTEVKPPLKQSHQQLNTSSQRDKTIIFLTDGSPGDISNPKSELDQVLGKNRDYSIFAIGLYQSQIAEDKGKFFLTELTSEPQDILKLTDNPSDVVPFFMEGFAKVLGSKPEISKLSNTTGHELAIPKYVTEIFVALTSDKPKDSFQSSIKTNQGLVSPTSAGDNNCSAITNCRYFETYRISHNPMNASTMTVDLKGASNPINFSVIYRYDLIAEMSPLKDLEVGEVLTIKANLKFQQAVFQDSTFFEEDNFEAFVQVGTETIPLNHLGGGKFETTFTPAEPKENEKVTVFFKNDWMEQKVSSSVNITGTLDLRLVVPNVDLGQWAGSGEPIQKCQTVDISQSSHADVVPLQCSVENLPAKFKGTCTPSASHTVPPGKQPVHFDVCIESPKCCGSNDGEPASLWLKPKPSRYADKASETRITYDVEKTSFWNCYWKEILITLGTLFLAFIIYGYKRPHRFTEGMSYKEAKNKRMLDRASTMYAEDQDNGKPGFYRNARLAFDSQGEILNNVNKSMLVLEAGPSGTTVFTKAAGLEYYDPNKRRWITLEPEDLELGHKARGIYRCGDRVYQFM